MYKSDIRKSQIWTVFCIISTIHGLIHVIQFGKPWQCIACCSQAVVMFSSLSFCLQLLQLPSTLAVSTVRIGPSIQPPSLTGSSCYGDAQTLKYFPVYIIPQ